MASTDAMRERIAAHPWPCGGVEVIRANRGYTLYSRRTGGQVARLRPTGEDDDVQVLWWRREAWATPGGCAGRRKKNLSIVLERNVPAIKKVVSVWCQKKTVMSVQTLMI